MARAGTYTVVFRDDAAGALERIAKRRGSTVASVVREGALYWLRENGLLPKDDDETETPSPDRLAAVG